MTTIEMAVLAKRIMDKTTNIAVGDEDIVDVANRMQYACRGLEFGKAFASDGYYENAKSEFADMAAEMLLFLLIMCRRHEVNVNDVWNKFEEQLKQ